jgi:hypothetical protein
MVNAAYAAARRPARPGTALYDRGKAQQDQLQKDFGIPQPTLDRPQNLVDPGWWAENLAEQAVYYLPSLAVGFLGGGPVGAGLMAGHRRTAEEFTFDDPGQTDGEVRIVAQPFGRRRIPAFAPPRNQEVGVEEAVHRDHGALSFTEGVAHGSGQLFQSLAHPASASMASAWRPVNLGSWSKASSMSPAVPLFGTAFNTTLEKDSEESVFQDFSRS